jgi:hypothetical protein
VTQSDLITIIAAAVTIVCTGISIYQARSAFLSSKAARKALNAVKLAALSERLKSAQEHIRDVAPERTQQRGFKIGSRIDLIRREFDYALNALPMEGNTSNARVKIKDAQVELNRYQKSISSGPDAEIWQSLQVHVQDAVSELSTATQNLSE